MQGNRGRDTALELGVRSLVHRMGFRFRVNVRIDAERPIRTDIVFPNARLVVFLDGCFWHLCPLHSSIPKTNRAFWVAKLQANERRDTEATITLRAAGWNVLRIWEHEGVQRSAEMIARVLDRSEGIHERANGHGRAGSPTKVHPSLSAERFII